MTVTMDQVVSGLAKYITAEFVEHVDGLKKWAVIGASSLIVTKSQEVGSALAKNAIVQSLGAMDKDGRIAIDLLKEHFSYAADTTGPITQQIPLLGPVTFAKEDIQKLYDFIVKS